jgi:hypothetical protein
MKCEKDGPGGKKETHIPKNFYVWAQKKAARYPQKGHNSQILNYFAS